MCPSQAGPVLWDVRSPACCLPAAALAAGAGAGCRCQESEALQTAGTCTSVAAIE